MNRNDPWLSRARCTAKGHFFFYFKSFFRFGNTAPFPFAAPYCRRFPTPNGFPFHPATAGQIPDAQPTAKPSATVMSSMPISFTEILLYFPVSVCFFVKEKNILTLEKMIHKMTDHTAEWLCVANKGLLRFLLISSRYAIVNKRCDCHG